ncbi:MAG: hypothetical protein IKX31_08895 [Muribaculaceae bacterium]|nr:hypothetical protein [Muribaculaceae bacterium]
MTEYGATLRAQGSLIAATPETPASPSGATAGRFTHSTSSPPSAFVCLTSRAWLVPSA